MSTYHIPIFKIPDSTEAFEALPPSLQDMWRRLKHTSTCLIESRDPIPDGADLTEFLEAVSRYKEAELAELEASNAKDMASTQIIKFMLRAQIGFMETRQGDYISISPAVAEVADLVTLRELYPGAFAAVPDKLAIFIE